MDALTSLPCGPLYDTLDFLSFPEILKCACLNKTMLDSLFHQTHILFRQHLDRDFPSYQPFESLSNLECLRKLISFHSRDFKWESLGTFDEHVTPRYLHRSAISSEGDMIFFGGGGPGNSYFNDTWKVSFESNESKVCFQKYAPTSQDPSPRGSCAMAIYNGYIFCFGGRVSSGSFLNGLMALELDTGDWSEVHPSSHDQPTESPNCFPPHRWGHSVVEWQGLLILFGGGEYGRTFNDLWVLDLKSLQKPCVNSPWRMQRGWRQINEFMTDSASSSIEQPRGRSGHVCVVLQEHFMYMLGGNNLNETFQEMWRIDLDIVAESYFRAGEHAEYVYWERIPMGNLFPEPQIGHAAVSLGSVRFVLFGGRNVHGGRMISGTMMYDSRDNSWESFDNISNHEQILNRTGHCALPTERGVMFVGGLREDTKHSSEIISLDLFSGSSSCIVEESRSNEPGNQSYFNIFNIVNSFSNRIIKRSGGESVKDISNASIDIVRGANIGHVKS